MDSFSPLFVFSVLLERVVLVPDAMLSEVPLSARVQFLQLEPLEVSAALQQQPHKQGIAFQGFQERHTEPFYSSARNMAHYMKRQPLVVTLFQQHPAAPLPVVQGSASVSVAQSFCELLERARRCAAKHPLNAVVHGEYPVCDVEDPQRQVGTVTLSARLHCFDGDALKQMEEAARSKRTGRAERVQRDAWRGSNRCSDERLVTTSTTLCTKCQLPKRPDRGSEKRADLLKASQDTIPEERVSGDLRASVTRMAQSSLKHAHVSRTLPQMDKQNKGPVQQASRPDLPPPPRQELADQGAPQGVTQAETSVQHVVGDQGMAREGVVGEVGAAGQRPPTPRHEPEGEILGRQATGRTASGGDSAKRRAPRRTKQPHRAPKDAALSSEPPAPPCRPMGSGRIVTQRVPQSQSMGGSHTAAKGVPQIHLVDDGHTTATGVPQSPSVSGSHAAVPDVPQIPSVRGSHVAVPDVPQSPLVSSSHAAVPDVPQSPSVSVSHAAVPDVPLSPSEVSGHTDVPGVPQSHTAAQRISAGTSDADALGVYPSASSEVPARTTPKAAVPATSSSTAAASSDQRAAQVRTMLFWGMETHRDGKHHKPTYHPMSFSPRLGLAMENIPNVSLNLQQGYKLILGRATLAPGAPRDMEWRSPRKESSSAQHQRTPVALEMNFNVPLPKYGHNDCVATPSSVPGNQGWLWRGKSSPTKLQPRLGWYPGAIPRTLGLHTSQSQ